MDIIFINSENSRTSKYHVLLLKLTDKLDLRRGQKSNQIMTVCFYHVTYAFQSESTLYSCLNVKELLARSRREI